MPPDRASELVLEPEIFHMPGAGRTFFELWPFLAAPKLDPGRLTVTAPGDVFPEQGNAGDVTFNSMVTLVTLPCQYLFCVRYCRMSSDRPRIATYTTKQIVQKFRVVAAYKGKSMSDYLQTIIEDAINSFEQEHGEIQLPE